MKRTYNIKKTSLINNLFLSVIPASASGRRGNDRGGYRYILFTKLKKYTCVGKKLTAPWTSLTPSGRAAFTLIETLVAVALLLGAVMGPIALITHALYSAPFSRNAVIAYNLAQEGIELMRAVRDDIIICYTLGPVNLTNLGSLAPSYFEFDALDTTTITCGPQTITVPKPTQRTAATCNTPVRVTGTGEYTYTAGVATNFTRCVFVCSPPSAPPCNGVNDIDVPLIPPTDQTDIISTVSWIERGAPKSYTLRDRLYNWK